MKVFVTGANHKHTLGAIRSLGEKGLYVIAGSSSKYAPSFYSKYCKERVIYPKKEDDFVSFMLNFLKENKIDVLLPICYETNTVCSKYKNEFCQYTKLPIANYNSMAIGSDKAKTMKFAENLGIKIPKTYKTHGEIDNFPIVVKGIKGSGRIRYVNSLKELSKIKTSDSILQEYIPGEGYGFYALFNNGDARAIFMHKRIREFPVTGGASTAAESIHDSKLKDLGLKLLTALNWHGVAMVEFKKDLRDEEYKLMEINPKFWGSLDLSIAAGIDFPYLAVKMATEGDIKTISKYNIGIRFRWPFPDDIMHLVAKPSSIGVFFREFFDKKTKSNILLSDVKPNLLQVLLTFYILISRIRKGNFRFPHGIPHVRL